MAFFDSELQNTVRDLGKMLGLTIQQQLGPEWLARIEDVRKTGRRSNEGDASATDHLKTLFAELQDEDLLVLGRAFCQFLNLANIAEQEYNVAQQHSDPLAQLNHALSTLDVDADTLEQALTKLQIDLVLTAHPTEVSRRTLIHKYTELAECLKQIHQSHLTEREREKVEERIAELVAQAWYTDEIRTTRPTPEDEAQWGFSVIEKSLWQAVPDFIRELDHTLQQKFAKGVPLDAVPVRFSSWMGGDRDGNPFVTAKVTERVLLLARRRATDLFFKDVDALQSELSMNVCDDALRAAVGDEAHEPYRAVLRELREQLRQTYRGIVATLSGEEVSRAQWITKDEQLLTPLMLCYRSLHHCGMGKIADGALLDCIRRVHAFGCTLLRLDIRQDSGRHADVFSELTRYLDLGDYANWDEQQKQAFLLQELQSKRPLFPRAWQPSSEVQEVIDTCRVIAANEQTGFGIYIISMASEASDVLAVKLLLKECGVSWSMPVAPLFETLDDLNQAAATTQKLLECEWYKREIDGRQYVMIGYSDSAKDAGALAAGWAQYRSQEALVALAKAHNVTLTLFHGRGGTIGRGGLPAAQAIHSQPPGSLDGGFRVTEQGETIRYKFGMPKLALQSLALYASAILQAVVAPPPAPKQAWRDLLDSMAQQACDNYRAVVRHDKNFVPYFRAATPELELGKLPLGSRPAKRRPEGGVESLRAIPWIFAWAQTRLVLPSWLGVMPAIRQAIEQGQREHIEQMLSDWPFFHSRLSMLDMVFHKADASISAAYDSRLVPEDIRYFGDRLRTELADSMALILDLLGQQEVMEKDPQGKASMQLRAHYLQPLHFLQIELLERVRKYGEQPVSPVLERAMMITIAGIAVGMRNTG
ncbi:phosphoenolpyruvate carboxylase [Bowmanella sp. JS7-9]|uniref:Phosphoenolpyruvate carboxylase n=1 Tax=Pseudobowmanella zhangzhouensis TaxID=1537679 RepID=A0ABW1XRW4_9ALTE|nr:phosphoenolpyruvate carboxylase [Bowmanella sp. JS7-9]TBX23692.1 phosphoenolpyruvate carboxylase [Bowmanella sp. JS7-9]